MTFVTLEQLSGRQSQYAAQQSLLKGKQIKKQLGVFQNSSIMLLKATPH